MSPVCKKTWLFPFCWSDLLSPKVVVRSFAQESLETFWRLSQEPYKTSFGPTIASASQMQNVIQPKTTFSFCNSDQTNQSIIFWFSSDPESLDVGQNHVKNAGIT